MILLVSPQRSLFVDEVLGEFITHDPPRGESAWRNWSGSLMWGAHGISLGVGGDARGPESLLLVELRNVVRHLDEIVSRAAKALAECAPEYEITEFRIESISVWDEVDDIFEITFESSDPEARPNVETHWPLGQVVHHRIVIARDYRVVRKGAQLRLPTPKVPADYPDPKPE
jgi:hypothetical protein